MPKAKLAFSRSMVDREGEMWVWEDADFLPFWSHDRWIGRRESHKRIYP